MVTQVTTFNTKALQSPPDQSGTQRASFVHSPSSKHCCVSCDCMLNGLCKPQSEWVSILRHLSSWTLSLLNVRNVLSHVYPVYSGHASVPQENGWLITAPLRHNLSSLVFSIQCLFLRVFLVKHTCTCLFLLMLLVLICHFVLFSYSYCICPCLSLVSSGYQCCSQSLVRWARPSLDIHFPVFDPCQCAWPTNTDMPLDHLAFLCDYEPYIARDREQSLAGLLYGSEHHNALRSAWW